MMISAWEAREYIITDDPSLPTQLRYVPTDYLEQYVRDQPVSNLALRDLAVTSQAEMKRLKEEVRRLNQLADEAQKRLQIAHLELSMRASMQRDTLT